jgi:hypothetical protein
MKLNLVEEMISQWCRDLDIDTCDTHPVEELARALVVIRDARSALATVADDIASALSKRVGGGRVLVIGVGEFIVRRAVRRSDWDHEALWQVVAARALDERRLDHHTGEVEPAHEAVSRVLATCIAPTWRITALRERGIDETEYCHADRDRTTVQLPPTRRDNTRLIAHPHHDSPAESDDDRDATP